MPSLIWWGDFVFASKGDRQVIPSQFSPRSIIVGVEAGESDYLYRDIAFLIHQPFIPGFGWTRGQTIGLSTGFNLVDFSENYDYRLSIVPAYNVKNLQINLKIWEREPMALVAALHTGTLQNTIDYEATTIAAADISGSRWDRVGGLIVNTGQQAMLIAFGVTADSTKGIPLYPGGNLDIPPFFTGKISVAPTLTPDATHRARLMVYEVI